MFEVIQQFPPFLFTAEKIGVVRPWEVISTSWGRYKIFFD